MARHALEVVVHHERGVGGIPERARRRPLIHQFEAPLGQLQALGHLPPPDQHRPGADAVLVSVEELAGSRHAAEEVCPFQDKHFRAALGQHVGGDQAVVARPDDDRVIVRHADSSGDDPLAERTMSHLTYLRQWRRGTRQGLVLPRGAARSVAKCESGRSTYSTTTPSGAVMNAMSSPAMGVPVSGHQIGPRTAMPSVVAAIALLVFSTRSAQRWSPCRFGSSKAGTVAPVSRCIRHSRAESASSGNPTWHTRMSSWPSASTPRSRNLVGRLVISPSRPNPTRV